MKTVEFLAYLRNLDIQVSIEDDRLRCNAPEGVLTPELRNQVAARKAEIIAFLQQATSQQAIGNALGLQASSFLSYSTPSDSTAPLSFAQQRLWFLEQLVPGNPFYNIPTAVRLTGALNIAALEQTFNKIVRRHQILRTAFRLVAGQPMQVILPMLTIDLPIIDLQHLPQPELQAQRLMHSEAQRPFQLASEPLLRVQLLQLHPQEFVLLLTMHHIIADGWSIGILIRELGMLYAAFTAGQPSPLPALPIQYADFARWQRQWLQGDVLATQLGYWQQQLADLPTLELPIDFPRPPVQTYRGATKVMPLSRSLHQALEALSQQAGATLFMTLLAAFQTLLYRYTGQTDIAIGSPIANRNRSEIEGLIGFFVNSLVMRTDLSGNPTFRDLLGRVRSMTLAAYAHQDLPFERLVEALQPDRDLSRNPLFQTVFALQNAPTETLKLPDITLSSIEVDAGTTRFDLEFHVSTSAQLGSLGDADAGAAGLNVMAVYNTDLFAPDTIDRLLSSFQILLTSIVAQPDQPMGTARSSTIAQLPILSQPDRDWLAQWNQTEADYSKQPIHQQFEAQVQQTPDALAIGTPTQQLTYADLNRRSNQLAHYLRSIGITTETPVGICVDRSADLTIGLLAILKVGGAYLPIDPAYPADRMAFMLADAQVSVLLTQSHIEISADITASIDRIDLDTQEATFAQFSPDNLDRPIASDQLAYIIYTSGSTGRPKGVLVEQSSLSNLIGWHRQAFGVEATDRAMQIAGIAFDACGWELFPYLTAGASVHFPPEETRLSPSQLRDWIVQQAITISFLPTPIAERVLTLDWSNTALRFLLTGGDKLRQVPPALPFALVNNYGLTETTVVATSGQVLADAAVPSIGQPIANTQLYLLDADRQLVPIGAKGEIYIGGEGLARGYLNQPALTAERFIRSPWGGGLRPGFAHRLYKTGDLARYRADGSLEFLGRLDEQVQIRGCRIELGEIESVLMQHPAVAAAIAIVRDEAIVAYVTSTPHSIESPQDLQDEQVLQWQMLYEETYSQPAPDPDPTFNRVGWNSSYTGQPLAADQIREWVDRRVQQILALQPRRVLEIGCGTGLLLFQLAPHCVEYWGTDFSPVSLRSIQQQLGSLPQVKLLDRMATDFKDIAPASFDMVILNSVVQYFPSIDYLMQVLAGSIAVLAPGGCLFLGDIRSLPLLPTLHTAIQLHQAEPSLSKAELRQRIQTQLLQESELVLDPAFFQALPHAFPAIDRVEIHLTQGHYHNEMTQFRYNVTLQIKQQSQTSPAQPLPCEAKRGQVSETLVYHLRHSRNDQASPINWSDQQVTLPIVRHLLEKQPDSLVLAHIPNARLQTAVRAIEWLEDPADDSVASFCAGLQDLPNAGIDPEALIALTQDLPYQVQLTWSDAAPTGCFNAVFTHRDTDVMSETPADPPRPWHCYANNPLQAKVAAQLVPQLRSILGKKLPDYMMPGAIVVLPELPLTPNGKVNRHALPAPDFSPSRLTTAFMPPRSSTEQLLAEIWCSVLGLKSVGINDNFFERGGHSLLATQLVSRVRDALQIELPLRSLFETPTIAGLAKEIEQLPPSAQLQAPTIAPLPRQAYRMTLPMIRRDL